MNVYITTILAVASPSIAIGYYRSKKKKKKEKAKCTRRFIHFDLCLPLSGSCTRKIPCHASICLYAMAMQRLIA